MPADAIELRGLRVTAICGVLAHERTNPQPLEIDVDIEADLSRAGASDALADTIDYGAVVAEVERVATTLQPLLLELLLELTAQDHRFVSGHPQTVHENDGAGAARQRKASSTAAPGV